MGFKFTHFAHSFAYLLVILILYASLVDSRHASKNDNTYLSKTGTKYSVGQYRGFLVGSAINQDNVRRYHNHYAGQTAVIFGNGATLNKYRHSDYDELGKRVVTFGSNGIIYSGLPVDHLFIADPAFDVLSATGVGYKANEDAIRRYKPRVAKWFCFWRNLPEHGPDLASVQQAGGKYFESEGPTTGIRPLVADVGDNMFASMSSSAFFALQFALYTGVDRVFLVGVDVDSGNFTRHAYRGFSGNPLDLFRGKTQVRADNMTFSSQHEEWRAAAMFTQQYYPHVKVVVVNPVGLSMLGDWEAVRSKNGIPFTAYTTSAGYIYLVFLGLWYSALGLLCLMCLAKLQKSLQHSTQPVPALMAAVNTYREMRQQVMGLPGVHRLASSPEFSLCCDLTGGMLSDLWRGVHLMSDVFFSCVTLRCAPACSRFSDTLARVPAVAALRSVPAVQTIETLVWTVVSAPFLILSFAWNMLNANMPSESPMSNKKRSRQEDDEDAEMNSKNVKEDEDNEFDEFWNASEKADEEAVLLSKAPEIKTISKDDTDVAAADDDDDW